MKADQERVDATAAVLRAAADQAGLFVTPDGRVGEADAAWLTGYEPAGLRAARSLGTGPAYYRRSAGGARISYAISDLATWIEAARES